MSRCFRFFGPIAIAAIAMLGSTETATARGPSPGDIEKDAYARYSGKYEISKIDVLNDPMGEGGMSDGYYAWISVEGCKGNIMLSYDQAGLFKTSSNTLKCDGDGG